MCTHVYVCVSTYISIHTYTYGERIERERERATICLVCLGVLPYLFDGLSDCRSDGSRGGPDTVCDIELDLSDEQEPSETTRN